MSTHINSVTGLGHINAAFFYFPLYFPLTVFVLLADSEVVV